MPACRSILWIAVAPYRFPIGNSGKRKEDGDLGSMLRLGSRFADKALPGCTKHVLALLSTSQWLQVRVVAQLLRVRQVGVIRGDGF